MTHLRFAVLNTLEAAIWAVVIALTGYNFGHAMEAILGDIERYKLEQIAFLVIVGRCV